MFDALLSDCTLMRKKLQRISRFLPYKRFGQYFIRDCSIGYLFAKVLADLNSCCVIEVGSGLGFLTRFISRVTKQVISVELDLRLIPHLREYLRDLENVHVVAADGSKILNSCRCDTLVSNTPYYISSLLLINFVKSDLRHAVLMLQREVADRLISQPGERIYGRISAFLSTFASVKKIKDFPPDSFFPTPKVSSSLVSLTRKRRWDDSWLAYEDILRYIFTQRRKLVEKVFRHYINQKGIHLPKSDISFISGKRVYELSINELIQLYALVSRVREDHMS